MNELHKQLLSLFYVSLLKYLTTELGAANVKGKNAGESVKMLWSGTVQCTVQTSLKVLSA